MVDGAVLFTLVAVTAAVGRVGVVSGWRCTLLGGALAGLAATGTWMFDLPRWVYVVAGFVVATAVFLGLGADLIRLSRRPRPVPLGATIEESLRGLLNSAR
ncbi:hypothetical protein GCM10010532_036600 [Dactylosporangium siamense]|uniref:Uncharacterized protein n=1 Tax=Dactylosporangium siamense TaxID=685454 RepID=A0A919UAU4_9ACTN|nr:hypothetical protein Dsi01nite_029020 [Dactylosporangium siamense]